MFIFLTVLTPMIESLLSSHSPVVVICKFSLCIECARVPDAVSNSTIHLALVRSDHIDFILSSARTTRIERESKRCPLSLLSHNRFADGEDDHEFLTSDEEDEEESDVAEKRANVEDWNNWGEVVIPS